MSFFTDSYYIKLLSGSLRNFKQKTTELFNCSCPFCGDSTKDKTKARGYFFRDGDRFAYKCHNCGISTSTGSVIRLVNPSLFNDYRLENFKDNTFKPKRERTKKIEFVEEQPVVVNISPYLVRVSELPDKHKAKEYAIRRMIPDLSRVYYTDNWNTFAVNEFGDKYIDSPTEERLVLAYCNTSNVLQGAQGRNLTKTGIRYISAKKDGTELVYGLESWNKFKHTYILEGPIDSLFVENALAVGSSSLATAFQRHPQLEADKVTLVFDNEPRSKEIIKLMSSAIDKGFNVCIHEKNIVSKDINDMIKKGELTKEDIMVYLKRRTFKNLQARFEFNNWKEI